MSAAEPARFRFGVTALDAVLKNLAKIPFVLELIVINLDLKTNFLAFIMVV